MTFFDILEFKKKFVLKIVKFFKSLNILLIK